MRKKCKKKWKTCCKTYKSLAIVSRKSSNFVPRWRFDASGAFFVKKAQKGLGTKLFFYDNYQRNAHGNERGWTETVFVPRKRVQTAVAFHSKRRRQALDGELRARTWLAEVWSNEVVRACKSILGNSRLDGGWEVLAHYFWPIRNSKQEKAMNMVGGQV